MTVKVVRLQYVLPLCDHDHFYVYNQDEMQSPALLLLSTADRKGWLDQLGTFFILFILWNTVQM